MIFGETTKKIQQFLDKKLHYDNWRPHVVHPQSVRVTPANQVEIL